MNVFGDFGQIDTDKFLDYVARQLPADVATLVQARDEIALRQGALTAVQDAAKLRADAKAELDAAKKDAAVLVAEAQRKLEENKLLQNELNANLRAYDLQAESFKRDSTAKWSELAAREKAVAIKEADVASREEKMRFAQDALQAERQRLDARIKAFQDKVASLSI